MAHPRDVGCPFDAKYQLQNWYSYRFNKEPSSRMTIKQLYAIWYREARKFGYTSSIYDRRGKNKKKEVSNEK
tara:strand:- start:159 stop:374 length:216 start_codon:yes stop_codon:yes gene_type:complete